MKQHIILVAALISILHVDNAEAYGRKRSRRRQISGPAYIFANVTGHHSKGYVIRIDDDQGNELRTLGPEQADYIPVMPRYEITGLKKGEKKAGTFVFEPEEFNPELGIERPVVIINFRRLFNKGIAPEQFTYEEAQERYGDRIRFPKPTEASQGGRKRKHHKHHHRPAHRAYQELE